MKQKEIIKAISKSQDNDVLVKGFADSDFLSRFLMSKIKFHTNPVTDEVDLDELWNDLNYAVDQIEKARAVVERRCK